MSASSKSPHPCSWLSRSRPSDTPPGVRRTGTRAGRAPSLRPTGTRGKAASLSASPHATRILQPPSTPGVPSSPPRPRGTAFVSVSASVGVAGSRAGGGVARYLPGPDDAPPPRNTATARSLTVAWLVALSLAVAARWGYRSRAWHRSLTACLAIPTEQASTLRARRFHKGRADLKVQALDRVGGVDDPPHLRRERQERVTHSQARSQVAVVAKLGPRGPAPGGGTGVRVGSCAAD